MKVIDSLSCRISENSKRSAAKSCKDVCVSKSAHRAQEIHIQTLNQSGNVFEHQ